MKEYRVKEIFHSLQGEGFHSGRSAVFCRFSGCNLWNGREDGRLRGPGSCSSWCDTDFSGTDGTFGGRYRTESLSERMAEVWGHSRSYRFAILTGGEPMLQVDGSLVDCLHRLEFEVAIETNGTIHISIYSLDWITLSPKAGSSILLNRANELKLVYPQEGNSPEQWADFPASHFYLQPMDGPNIEENTKRSMEFCIENPKWKLSIQKHKLIGIR